MGIQDFGHGITSIQLHCMVKTYKGRDILIKDMSFVFVLADNIRGQLFFYLLITESDLYQLRLKKLTHL